MNYFNILADDFSLDSINNKMLLKSNIIDFNNPIIIGDVKVNPGDYVFGDIDGVVCIPKEIIDDVIIQAEEVKEKEDIVRGELSAGKNIRDLFEKYKVF